MNSCPAPCPTDSTLKPSNMASFSGPALGVHPVAGTLGTVVPGIWSCGSQPVCPPGAKAPAPHGPAASGVMSSPGFRDLEASGTAQGSLCLPARWWVREQTHGVQPLPAPLHTVQSWVCSLHSSPLPPRHTRGHPHSSPASVSTALRRDPRLLPGRLTPQLFPTASKMREQVRGHKGS